jgi:coenzyme F420 hydrogenase subunit beta
VIDLLKDDNIKRNVELGLCVGCGTCSSMCPSNAIDVEIDAERHIYLPEIKNAKCGQCHLCLKICPAQNVDFLKLNKDLFGRKLGESAEEILLGSYTKCYSGYSTNPEIRFHSSSGGMITQLLVFALEQGLIDGALVTRMKRDRPLEPESFIARTRNELLEASTSKYCPVSANLALREILEKEGKYAIVGLPCHIQGIRKAEFVNAKLQKRIIFHLGIFCSHADNFCQIDYLLNHWTIKQSNIKQINFRGEGWPGISKIQLKSGNQLNCPYLDWTIIHELCFFTPLRCFVCYDHTAELADISFGDAWMPEFSDDKIGRSVIISRSGIGRNLLLKAESNKQIALHEVSALKIAKSQGMVRFKKKGFHAWSIIFRLTGKQTPQYSSVKLAKPSLLDLTYSMMFAFNALIGSNHCLWSVLPPIIKMQKKMKEFIKSKN